jgi:signal transduction histidine kinase
LQNEELKQSKAEVDALLEKYTDLYDFAPVGYFTLLDDGTIQLVNLTASSLVGIDRAHLIGRRFGLLVSPEHRPRFNSFLKLVFGGLARQSGDFELLSQGEPPRTVNIEARRMPDGLECRAAMVDISQRLRDASMLRASETRYRSLFEVSPVAIYTTGVSGLIEKFNLHAAELWGREPVLRDTAEQFWGAFKLFRPDGSVLPYEQCPMADVATGRIAEALGTEMLVERPDGARISVVVNIRAMRNERGEVTGTINCLYDITESKKAASVLQRAEMLAAANVKLVRSEYDSKQLLAKSQRMQKQLRHVAHQILVGQENLRKEISRELHDKIIQFLVGINIHLEGFVKAAQINPESVRRKIVPVRRQVEKAVQTVHQFARDLRPAMLDDLGLVSALHSHLKVFSKRTAIKVRLTAFARVDSMDNDKLTMLYRVAQEALTNVEKHAQASVVNLAIRKARSFVRLEISDDGKAFDVVRFSNSKVVDRLGLTSMRERVEMFGGRFSVVSIPGTGTTVRADVPFGKNKMRQ